LAGEEAAAAPYAQRNQAQATQPTMAQPRPFPTTDELASFDDATLIQTLRDLSAQLLYSLQRFDKAAGWQRYLDVSYAALGNASAEPSTIQLDVLEKQLARYDKVSAGGQFAKIAALPSFGPTHAALILVVERFSQPSPVTVDLDPFGDHSHDPGPVTEPAEGELLPSPPPSPEPRSSQRSIIIRRR
jgi:hypothetical protein